SLELTAEEKDLLEKYLSFYRALDNGTRQPTTPEQHHFVAVCQARAGAETMHEMAYAKHRMQLAKKRAEERDGRVSEIPELPEGLATPDWFTDEDWYKLRNRYP